MDLNQEQLETMTAIMDRIIPKDAYPAASEAGVDNYIFKLYSDDLLDGVETFILGLDGLRQEAMNVYGSPFSTISEAEKDTLIDNILHGSVAFAWSVNPAHFMRSMINIVSEGYYADPENGGNFESASWDMVGFKVIEGHRLTA